MKLLLKLSLVFLIFFMCIKVSFSLPLSFPVYIETFLTNNAASKSFYMKNKISDSLFNEVFDTSGKPVAWMNYETAELIVNFVTSGIQKRFTIKLII